MSSVPVSPSSPIPPMSMDLRLRLSVMMFLEFAIWGAWFVVFTGYLEGLKFTASQASQIFGTMALGAVISPMFVGLVADRYFSSERLMAILHIAGAGLLYWMATIQSPDQYEMLYAVTLIYALVYNPTLALTNSIAFTHVPDGTRDFPGLRVLGTISWILVNIYVGKMLDATTNEPLMMAAGLSALMGVFCFFLPHTPPKGKAGEALPYRRAFQLFKDRSFAVFFVISFLITIVLAFYYSFTYPYLVSQLKYKDVPIVLDPFLTKEAPPKPPKKDDVTADKNASPVAEAEAVPPAPDADTPTKAPRRIVDVASTMTIGQISEMVLLPFLPLFLRYLGMKWVLVLGMLAWGIRYWIFSMGEPWGLMILAVALHGICFDFFFAAGFIYVDKTAPTDLRASGQALFAALTYGLGMWLGSMLSGIMKDYFTDPATGLINWPMYWIIPSMGVFAATLVFVLFFRIEKKSELPTNGGSLDSAANSE